MPVELAPLADSTTGEGTEARAAQPPTWLARYEDRGLGRLSDTARTVVRADANFIADQCVSPETVGAWPSSRVRTGIVIGAVQSGKTASMLGVAATLLDRGVDILVVLAGTRISLWKQTYDRFLSELDGTDLNSFRSRLGVRQLIPRPSVIADPENRPGAPQYLAPEKLGFSDSLAKKRPVILILPKIESHLREAYRFLETHLAGPGATVPSRDLHLVVIDDEADDGSILDAAGNKSIPRTIQMLWTGRQSRETMLPRLYATYVAYTATPQANLLQLDHNPLAPRDFCVALRTPYKSGTVEPRDVTFEEPAGLPKLYTGGEFFYREPRRWKEPAQFVQTLPFPEVGDLSEAEHGAKVRAAADKLLLDALRAYLVGAALRLFHHMRSGGLSYSNLTNGVASDEVNRIPAPHSMLVHPSARVDAHLREATRLLLLAHGMDPDGHNAPQVLLGELRLNPHIIGCELSASPAPWQTWMERFSRSRDALLLWPGVALRATDVPWETLRELIVEHVVPAVRIRIINSDPNADDRPIFTHSLPVDGRVQPAPDLLTIFVSGNVMSRGLTIDGLYTSVFTRGASEPAADTQMQMQRWFGYRGAEAHLCRLFCFEDQLELFRTYHDHDTSLRREILSVMRKPDGRSPIMVLTGSRSLATAKVPTTRLPLHPGPSPFVSLVEFEEYVRGNAQHLDELMKAHDLAEVRTSRGTLVGVRLTKTFSLTQIADILDGFRYTHHDPDPLRGLQYSRWQSVQRRYGIDVPLFRPPNKSPGNPAVDVRHCPYSIAAYLRFWDAALSRKKCEGLHATHAPDRSWEFVHGELTAPVFHIGIKYGSMTVNSWEPQGLLRGVRAMSRSITTDADGAIRLEGTWGSRGGAGVDEVADGAYLGDQRFDYHFTGFSPPSLREEGGTWRPKGHPALLLFQVVHAEGHTQDAVTVGLALPHGGPDQFAAMR
jgi:hypothetical protein